MTNGDPGDGFFYPILTDMIDSYIVTPLHVAAEIADLTPGVPELWL